MSQTAEEREFFLRHGVSPSAKNRLAIDFDGTLFPDDDLFGWPKPNTGAVRAMQRFKRAGFHLIVWTSRLSPEYLADQGEDYDEHRAYVEKMLDDNGIPFDDVTGTKPPAFAYIDNRALRYDGDWEAIADYILFSRGE